MSKDDMYFDDIELWFGTLTETDQIRPGTFTDGNTIFMDTFNNSEADGWSRDDGSGDEMRIDGNQNYTSSKTFSFGAENAGKNVTLEFDADTKNWESGDKFVLTVNGVAAPDYTGDRNEIITYDNATIDSRWKL